MKTRKMLEKDKAFRICKNDYEFELVAGHCYLDVVQDESKQRSKQKYIDMASDLCNRLDAAGVTYEIEYGKPKDKTYARLLFDNPNHPKIYHDRTNRDRQRKRQNKLDDFAKTFGFKSWGVFGTAILNDEIKITVNKK